MTHYNFVHKFIPVPQAVKIPGAEAAVGTEWKKLEAIPACQLDKLKSKKKVILEAQNDKNSTFCVVNEHLSSQECGVRTNISEVLRSSRTPR